MEKGQMKFQINNEEVTFNIGRSIKQIGEVQSVTATTYTIDSLSEVQIDERLGVESLVTIVMNFESDDIEDYDEWLAALQQFEYRSKMKRQELDRKNHKSPPSRPSIEKASTLQLKALPLHVRYVFVCMNKTLPVITVAYHNGRQVECLVAVLKRFKRATGWTTQDIIEISLVFVFTKFNPSIDHQRRLNFPMQEVIKKEIIKFFDTGVIYPIAQNTLGFPVQCVPKKGGITWSQMKETSLFR